MGPSDDLFGPSPVNGNGNGHSGRVLTLHSGGSWASIARRHEQDLEWIVDGLLPAGGQIIIAGSPKAKKTLLAMHLSICVATGRPFLGRAVKRRPVVYNFLEDGEARAARRIRALGALALGSELDEAMLQAFFELEGYARAREAMEAGDHLAVVDPLVELLASRGLDENKSTDMSKFFREHRLILSASGSALLLIHHFRKLGDMMRGSSAMMGSPDGWLNLEQGSKDPNAVKITYVQRDGQPGELGARLVVTGEQMTFEPCEVPRVAPSNGNGNGYHRNGAQPDNEASGGNAVNHIRRLVVDAGKALSHSEVHGAAAKAKLGIGREVMKVHLREMVESGDLKQDTDGRFQPTARLLELLAKQDKLFD